jgi:ankyrin repeat protein
VISQASKSMKKKTKPSISGPEDGQEEEKGSGELDAINKESGEVKEGDDIEDLDENEEDDHFDNHISLEVTHDYTKNTPLLWATQRGHLRVLWLLLANGYSPNDLDTMGNNAVHLAAALGDTKILQIIINDGGNANIVNHYKNHPIDMAKNKAVRDILAVSMIQDASLTDDDRAIKHEQTMRQVC